MNKLNLKVLENLGFCLYDEEARDTAENLMKDLQKFCENYINKVVEQPKAKEEKFSPYENFALLVNDNLETLKTEIAKFDEPLTKLFDKSYKDKTAVLNRICKMSISLYTLMKDYVDNYIEFRDINEI